MEDRQVKTVPCTIMAVLSAAEIILLQNYHEQHPPFPIHTNPPHEIHYVPIGDGWREVLVRNVIHYVPVLLPNHHL
jgi:hypothetical protein